MMASISAREYKEWEAYERAVGPLDSFYEREMLAELHELLQLNNLLTGASVTKKGKKNPAGKFRKAVRADQLYLPPEDDEDEEEPDDEDYEGEFADDDYEDDDEEIEEVVDPNAYDPAKDPFR